MSKYFSWKINDEQYAYLYIPNNKNHISSRITDTEVINKMIAKVSQWDEKKYKLAFDSMNEEVNEMFGINIPYSVDYFSGNNNVVVMGNSKIDNNDIENIKNELLDVIDERFAEIKLSIKDLNDELVELFNKRTIDTVKASREDFETMLSKFNSSKELLEIKFNKASKTLEKAAKVLELENSEINADSLKDLFKVTNNNKQWIATCSSDMERIKKDYEDYDSILPSNERGRGFFKHITENLEKVQDDVIKISNSNNEMKDSIKLLEIDKKEKILGSSPYNIEDIRKGNYDIKVTDEKIILSNIKNNASIVIDDDGIKIDGDVFINGNKF